MAFVFALQNVSRDDDDVMVTRERRMRLKRLGKSVVFFIKKNIIKNGFLKLSINCTHTQCLLLCVVEAFMANQDRNALDLFVRLINFFLISANERNIFFFRRELSASELASLVNGSTAATCRQRCLNAFALQSTRRLTVKINVVLFNSR